MESRVKLNREIYMRSLQDRLSKLPREDREMAMEYFREYFDEAGPENEAQAIEDLGSPKEAAEQIIMNMAVKNSEEVSCQSGETGVKRSFRAVWIGILAVFAAPIALPLAFAAVAVVVSIGIAVVSTLAALVMAGVAVLAAGVVTVILGAIMIFRSPANAVATMGAGFLCTGLGVLICPIVLDATKRSARFFVKIFGKMVRKFTKRKGE